MHSRPLAILALSALGLTHCNKAPAAKDAGGSAGIALITEGVSPHFQAVASKLEIGGASFTYAEEGEILDLLGSVFEEMLKGLPEAEAAKVPAGFSFKKVFGLVGLDSIKATGMSSRKVPGGPNHQRSFVYTPEGRKGLLSLTGGAAEPLLLTALAAKDTDLAVEFPLHLKDWAAEAWPVLIELAPKEERAAIEAMAATPQPPLGISYKEMAEKLSVRIALIATLMPEQSMGAPGTAVTFPGMNAAIVIDKLGWLKEALKQQLLPMLQQPDAPVEVVMTEGVVTARFRAPMGPAPMDFQPVFQLDEKADRLIIASRPGYLDALLGKEPRLTDQPEFASAWKGLPKEGNGGLFLSKRFMDTFIKAMKEGVPKSGDATDSAAALSVINLIAKHASAPQAVAFANLPDGILTVSNTSLPTASPASFSSITTVAVLSSLAVPAFTSVKKQADQTKALSNGRQVLLAVKMYSAEHDSNYPAELSELVSGGQLAQPELLMVGNEKQPWLYDRTLTDTSPGISIVLAAPFTVKSGSRETRVVIRNDGRAEAIPEEDFQRTKDFNLR